MPYTARKPPLPETPDELRARIPGWGADNPITETGVLAEPHLHPVASRRGRADVRHQVLDPLIVAGPWIAGALAGVAVLRAVRRR